MNIFYRVSPFPSMNKHPFSQDKKDIVYRSFKNFRDCLTDEKVTIVADSVPTDWYEIFRGYRVELSPSGNIETFHRQLDLICKLPNEEKVMLVEDDYLWQPHTMDVIERGLDEFDLISPYDHPGHYTEDRFIMQPKMMRLVDGWIWREAPSNTLTFATHAWLIKQNVGKMKLFGIRDHEMFMDLPHSMWVPVPSLATHCVEGLLAPGTDWSEIWQKYGK